MKLRKLHITWHYFDSQIVTSWFCYVTEKINKQIEKKLQATQATQYRNY